MNGVPLALAGAYAAANGNGYRVPVGTPLADGFLKIERQTRGGVWSDVTVEILNRGFTGRNLANANAWNSAGTTCATAGNADDPSPDAVIRLQRVRDNPSAGFTVCGHSAGGAWSTLPTDYLPLVLYDAREGARRDDAAGAGANPLLGGVMHYAELDVNNLRVWLATHADTMDVTGFVVYFSDRRGNKNLGVDGAANGRAGADGVLYTGDDFGDDRETGELGFEDVINPASAQSVANGALDTGEDVNGNGALDVYGGTPRLYPTARHGLPHGDRPGMDAGGRRDGRLGGGRRDPAHDGRDGERRAGQPAGVLPPCDQTRQRRVHERQPQAAAQRDAGALGRGREPALRAGELQRAGCGGHRLRHHAGHGPRVRVGHRRRRHLPVEQLQRHPVVHVAAQRHASTARPRPPTTGWR